MGRWGGDKGRQRQKNKNVKNGKRWSIKRMTKVRVSYDNKKNNKQINNKKTKIDKAKMTQDGVERIRKVMTHTKQ